MSKIIDFDRAKEGVGKIDTTYTFKRKRGRWECKHNRLQLDESTRMAECLDCGDTLDPFDVLLGYAEDERKTKKDIARWEAARREFEEIEKNWSLTIAEKRRIGKAVEQARLQND